MAQNQNNSSSKAVYKRINSINPFAAKNHHTSHKPRQPQTALTSASHPNPQLQSTNVPAKTNPVDSGSAKREILIVGGQGNDREGAKSVHVSAAKTQPSKNDFPIHDEGKKIERTKTNDKFSDYIRKVKDKMRNASNVGAVRSATKRDSFNDKVSSYINRAKIKIRTTTSINEDKGF